MISEIVVSHTSSCMVRGTLVLVLYYSEIVVSHTSSCMVRGTLVLVLYYSYTYWAPINRILLFTVLLPIPLLSISNSLELRFLAPNTGSSKTS